MLFCTFLCRPCTTTTWNDQILSFFEDRNSKAINSTISVWTQEQPPLFSSNLNSLLLSNRVTCENRKMVWKDAESIFSVTFSWMSPLLDRTVTNCTCWWPPIILSSFPWQHSFYWHEWCTWKFILKLKLPHQRIHKNVHPTAQKIIVTLR